MKNNENFLDKYRELENLLRNRLYQNSKVNSPVYEYIRELYLSPHENDQKRAEILDSIRELRNQMVHKNIDGIVNIDNAAITFLEKEIDIIKNPISAFDICIKLKDIHYATLNSHVKNIIKIMIEHGYSHIPVLNENKKLIGVFSENTIFSIFIANKTLLEKNDIILNDIENYLILENHQTECFGIASRDTHSSNIIKRFQKRKENNKRLSVIFVTEHGDITEPLIGMITPYDALIK